MSIRAMNWAMSTRTDGVSAQCVLLVVADTANEHGISIHADPDYIAERTRQSRATVFRRLKELETAGALTRLKRYRDDGAPVYEIRLNLAADIDYTTPEDGDPGAQDLEPESQIETPAQSQSETHKVSPVRVAESHSCDHKSPSKNPKEEIPPNPPSGGDRVVDAELEDDIREFAERYPIPITNLPKLRLVLGAMDRPERRKVLVAEHGYADFLADCERKRKPRSAMDAHRWVASGSWLGYVPAGERAQAAAQIQQVPIDSDAGKALQALHRIARIRPPIESAGTYLLTHPLSPQALAVAQAPPETEWLLIPIEQRNQCGAWNDLIAEALKGKNRPELVHDRNSGGVRGFKAPWPWPPRKDGSICSGSGPPISDPQFSPEDAQAMSK